MTCKIKVTALTLNNTDALDNVRELLLAQPGVASITITRTTAEFEVDAPEQAAAAVVSVMALLPSVGHPRASLPAVRRKLVAAVADLPNVSAVPYGGVPALERLLRF